MTAIMTAARFEWLKLPFVAPYVRLRVTRGLRVCRGLIVGMAQSIVPKGYMQVCIIVTP